MARKRKPSPVDPSLAPIPAAMLDQFVPATPIIVWERKTQNKSSRIRE